MKKEKNVAVLFSGGLDSTYLIYKNLKMGNIVKPIYINIKNNENKSIVEIQTIKLLINEFKREFISQLQEIEIVADIEIFSYSNIVSFPQPLLWLSLLSFGVSSKVEEIQIGYTMNDDALSFLDDFKRIYKNYSVFFDKKIPLKFPLTKTHKHTMLEELPKNYSRYITSCENPILKNTSIKNKFNGQSYRFYKPCGTCCACKRIIANNFYNSKIMREKYGEYLKQKITLIKNLL